MVDNAYLPGSRLAFAVPESDEDLCRYNYGNIKGPNCDLGVITITNHEYSYTPAQDANPPTLGHTVSTRQVVCGGKVGNCAAGPLKSETDIKADWSSALIIYETVKNEAFSQKREYESLIGTKYETFHYANFRRNLANPHIEYDLLSGNLVNYVNAFTGMTEIFPTLMTNYAAGKLYNNVTNIPGTDPYTDSIPNQRRTKALAAEAFMGLEGLRTSPYYTFYCLDGAKEMKGRIRMMVREWDRFFSTNLNTFDLITDADQYDNARIDNLTDPGEIPGDGDVLNPLNDSPDWDDLIPMTRTAGPLAPNATAWEPESGFFNTLTFPQVIIED